MASQRKCFLRDSCTTSDCKGLDTLSSSPSCGISRHRNEQETEPSGPAATSSGWPSARTLLKTCAGSVPVNMYVYTYIYALLSTHATQTAYNYIYIYVESTVDTCFGVLRKRPASKTLKLAVCSRQMMQPSHEPKPQHWLELVSARCINRNNKVHWFHAFSGWSWGHWTSCCVIATLFGFLGSRGSKLHAPQYTKCKLGGV